MELIVSHANADFDSLAAMVAAKKLYPEAEMAFGGSADSGVREFLTIHGDWLHILTPKEVPVDEVKRLIVVDTRESSRLGEFRELVEMPGVEVHVYDHHPPSYRDIVGNFNLVKPVGSTTTLLVHLIRQKKIPLNAHEATLLCTGIYVDTGSLSFPTTTPEDLTAAAWLLAQGASLRIVADYVNHSLSVEQRQLLNKLVLSSRDVQINGHTVLLTKASLDQYVDELALLTHRILDLERVAAVFSVVRMGDRVFVVGRSATPAIDVAEITAELGGGGHPTAASASLKGETVENAEAKLLGILRRRVRPTLTAQDVMNAPAWTIQPEKTVYDAHTEMLRFGARSFIVTGDGIIHGVISRRDVDKALNHGYGHAPVTAYMSRQLVVASPSTPLPEVQRLMIQHDIGRVPVVENGKVVGVVTRDGLLRGMSLQEFQKPVLASTLRIEDWSVVPDFVVRLLERAGEHGSALGVNVFAVGGFVRDLLLGLKNLDLDLVVEGDGIAFARALAEKLDARVRAHEKFGTAVLILPGDFKVDVATARAEYYARPAALPEVVGTSIKQDLMRRDFSINAMAIKLNPSEFGKLIDFFGGQRDLQHGVVRVLHNLSFVDDPTRIFRAIRFEQRYHFRMESHTEKLLRHAVFSGVVTSLSMERLRDELILILSESDPLPAIRRMARLKVLALIHPSLSLSEKGVGAFERIPQILTELSGSLGNDAFEAWIVYSLSLFSELLPEPLSHVLSRFRWTKPQREKLAFLLSDWKKLVYELSHPGKLSPSTIYRLLEAVPTEAALFLLAHSRNAHLQKRVKEYLVRLRKVECAVTGEDLMKLGVAPGPRYRELIGMIRDRQLDGEIHTRTEAEEFLKKEVEKNGEASLNERDEADREAAHRPSAGGASELA